MEKCSTVNCHVPVSGVYEMNLVSAVSSSSVLNSSISISGGGLWFSRVTVAGTFKPSPAGG